MEHDVAGPFVVAAILDVGDLVGSITAIWVSVLGAQVYYGLLALFIALPLYARWQSLSGVAIVWLLVDAFLQSLIPFAGFNIVHTLLVMGIGGLLYRLFSSYGKRE